MFHRKQRVNYFINSDKYFQKSFKIIRQEREAEVFAAYLLIPDEKLNAFLNEEWASGSIDLIPELAEEFQISDNFMNKRMSLRHNLDNMNAMGDDYIN